MDHIIIRTATMTDFESIQQLSTELAHSDVPFDGQIDLDWAYSESGSQYYREKIANGLCTVASEGDTVIGYSTYAVKEVPTWRLVKVAELENLFVADTHRGRGVGKKLMDQFLAWARSSGAHKASVSVFYPNAGAIQFYKRQGLKEYDMNLEMEL